MNTHKYTIEQSQEGKLPFKNTRYLKKSMEMKQYHLYFF